jgi:hypothetical protein
VPTILTRLNADPDRYPPEDPAAGWSIGGVYAILRNPKYTGYQVFGRTRNGKPVPPEKWYWSDQPTHPAIIDRATWDAAQAAGAAHLSARDTSPHSPANWRTYPLRSRIRCKICHRRMCGITHTHPHNKSRTEYAYYQCSFKPANPRHAAAHPDHPSTVAAREDLLLAQLYDGLTAYALGPGRAARLAQLIPAEADAQQALTDARATGIRTRLKQINISQDSLIHELATLPTDPADTAAMAMRARIRTHYADLHDEHDKLTRQLAVLTQQAPPAHDPSLIDLLPELAASLASLPADIQAGLIAAFDVQILWNPGMNQATFNATITDTTPSIIAALLDRASDNPTTSDTSPASTDPATSTNTHHAPAKNCGDPFTPLCAENSARTPGNTGARCGRR